MRKKSTIFDPKLRLLFSLHIDDFVIIYLAIYSLSMSIHSQGQGARDRTTTSLELEKRKRQQWSNWIWGGGGLPRPAPQLFDTLLPPCRRGEGSLNR